MTLVTGFTVDGLQAELDDLEATITALVNAQHTSDLAAYSDISEPVAVTVRNERIAAITQEQSDRDAAILVETNWRNFWVSAITPISKTARRAAAGTLTINSSTAWTNYDTATDLVLPAAAGDLIECSLSAVWGAEATGGFFDVVSIVGGNPVNCWSLDGPPQAPSTPTQGVSAWRGEANKNTEAHGAVARRLVAGDISGGNVTLRLRCGTSGAVNKTVYGTVGQPTHFRATNYKQG